MTTSEYTPGYSFKAQQSASPTSPLNGEKLDIEHTSISKAITSTQEELRKIQRSDGTLEYEIVGLNNLDNATLALVSAESGTPYPSWTALKTYQLRDIVNVNDATYIATALHVAGASFDADKAAGKWALFATPVKGDPRIYGFNYTGNGSTVAFALPVSPASSNDVFVFLNGVYQPPTAYTVVGTTLTFGTAPGSGVVISGRVAATLVESDGTDITDKTISYQGQKPSIQSFFEDAIYTGPAGLIRDGATPQGAKMQDLMDKAIAAGKKIVVTPVAGNTPIIIDRALVASGATWQDLRIDGISKTATLFSFTHDGPCFDTSSQGSLFLENLRIAGANSTPLPNTSCVTGGFSRGGMTNVELDKAAIGFKGIGTISAAINQVRAVNCTTGVYVEGISPGASFRDLYIDFCTNGVHFKNGGSGNAFFSNFLAHIEYCTNAFKVEGAVELDFQLWVEACTKLGLMGGVARFDKLRLHLAGTSDTVYDITGTTPVMQTEFQEQGTEIRTKDIVLVPGGYGDASVNTNERFARYTGFAGLVSDGTVFKGIATYARKAAGTGAAGAAQILFKRVFSFGGYRSIPMTSVTDFVTVKSNTVNVASLPVHANNAAAVSGGLVVNDIYVTSTGEVRIVV